MVYNILMVYASHSGKPEEEKASFWNEVFHLLSCILHNVVVMLAGDMNGHAVSSNAGYDGTHRGFGYGDRNADCSRILEFADRLNLVTHTHTQPFYGSVEFVRDNPGEPG